MVGMSPTSGYKKPAPQLARISRIGRVNPVGAPFLVASCEKEYCVLAIQMGSPAKPCFVYSSMAASCGSDDARRHGDTSGDGQMRGKMLAARQQLFDASLCLKPHPASQANDCCNMRMGRRAYCGWKVLYAVRSVHLPCDDFDLLLDSQVEGVQEPEVGALLASHLHRLAELDRSRAAQRMMLRDVPAPTRVGSATALR
jgi:hypothetical protein